MRLNRNYSTSFIIRICWFDSNISVIITFPMECWRHEEWFMNNTMSTTTQRKAKTTAPVSIVCWASACFCRCSIMTFASRTISPIGTEISRYARGLLNIYLDRERRDKGVKGKGSLHVTKLLCGETNVRMIAFLCLFLSPRVSTVPICLFWWYISLIPVNSFQKLRCSRHATPQQ